MKSQKNILIILICLLTLAVFMSCNKASDKKVAEAQNNAEALEAQNVAEKDWMEFKTTVEALIAVNEKTIADYKVKMTDTNGKLKASYDKKIDALELKNKEMKAKLNNYKNDGKTDWEQFKSEFNKDMDNLGTSLKGFVVDSKK
jgi:hypothetical protein